MRYPKFLKQEPSIFGIAFSDFCSILAVLSVAILIGLPVISTIIIGGTYSAYLILTHKFLPKNYVFYWLRHKNVYKWTNHRSSL